ncbi:hypothetical protein QQF64_018734 [Cirrhinus molitorella]|uniref:Uncharacterized protein n=1 Tax=Cirrhinus molitorella TaxID=172907 RepID=A0ABR3LHG8_9TELE
MSKNNCTAEELRRRHLSTRITARDRAKEFSNHFYEDGGVLFCKVCQHSVDYLRRQTALEHLKSLRHKNRAVSGIAERKEFVLDLTKALTEADIPLEKAPKLAGILQKYCKQGGSVPASSHLRSDYLPELFPQYIDEAGGRSQGEDRRELKQEEPGGTQIPAVTVAHGGADGGRSHGGGRADDSMGLTDGGRAGGGGARGRDGEPMIQGDAEDPEGHGGTGGTCDRGEDPESRSVAGAIEAELEERRSPAEPEGRSDEAQPEEWSPEAMAG